MKKQELQKILKPLIKECIKEVIFEEGVLSSLIKEVAVGIGSQQTIVEARVEEPTQDFSRQAVQLQEEQRLALEERKRKIEESIGLGSILEGVEPLASGGTPGEPSSNSPLSGYAANDPGVDISGLMALAGGQNWKKMI
tara:strand:- start:1526 stop:1942 length:417 start_codon:yes stop_codon:yes gene_type:complete